MNIKDIANLAGVSISTVSKIMNNKADNLTPETIERVLKIAKDYNYAPYTSKNRKTNSKTFIIAVLLKKAQDTNLFINGLLDECKKYNYSIMIFNSDNNTEDELKNITSICSYGVDGVIWEPVTSESLKHSHYFDELSIKTLLMNNPSTSSQYNSYMIDFELIGYEATRTLINAQHKNLAFLWKPNSIRCNKVLDGFKKCLFDYQIPFNNKMIIDVSDNIINRFSSNAPTAILCSHYANSLKVLEALETLHMSTPEDVSILTLRDDVRSNDLFPKISTCKIPYQEFGCFIANSIISMCENQPPKYESFFTEVNLENQYTIDLPSSLREKKILVVGSINLDITLHVNELPATGKTLSAIQSITTPGGKGINQSIGCAKLNKPVSLIGKLGNDYESTIILSSLEKNNVDSSFVEFDNKRKTGNAYIHVQNDGESTITIVKGANESLSVSDIKKSSRVFENTGYCLLQTEVPVETIEEAAKTAKFYGAKTILKPTTLTSIDDSLLKYIDILVPNEDEMKKICPLLTLQDQANYFLSKGVNTIIITRGKNGCYVKTNEFEKHYSPADVTVIDSTGAADAFISALSCYLLDGYDLDEAIQISTIAAGFCISRFGVSDSMIDKTSLDQYIISNGLTNLKKR